ncbi:MAG: hypothetical protein ACJ8H8_06250, partial [Geminicoccaceae bacterium]
MDSLELNKAAAAVLLAGIAFVGSGLIGKALVNPEIPDKLAINIAVPEGAAPAGSAAPEPPIGGSAGAAPPAAAPAASGTAILIASLSGISGLTNALPISPEPTNAMPASRTAAAALLSSRLSIQPVSGARKVSRTELPTRPVLSTVAEPDGAETRPPASAHAPRAIYHQAGVTGRRGVVLKPMAASATSAARPQGAAATPSVV